VPTDNGVELYAGIMSVKKYAESVVYKKA